MYIPIVYIKLPFSYILFFFVLLKGQTDEKLNFDEGIHTLREHSLRLRIDKEISHS